METAIPNLAHPAALQGWKSEAISLVPLGPEDENVLNSNVVNGVVLCALLASGSGCLRYAKRKSGSDCRELLARGGCDGKRVGVLPL